MEKKALNIFVSAIFVFAFFALTPHFVYAANLYFSPSSGSYAAGKTFSVGVYVSSADQAMNAASGIISFPNDKLEVASLSKSGSIFGLWVQEPSFSNSVGTINFEGIVLNPGFTGSGGKIISISFKTKAEGSAPLIFSSGSALANDGRGTDILTGLGNANFSIGQVKPSAPEAVTPTEASGVPTAPEISSPTHSDPNKWYAQNSAKFTWNVSKDISGVRLLVGRIPQAIPNVSYVPPISEKEVSDLEDGIWYLSVRLKNSAGWGGISYFRFQVDTSPPESFSMKFVDGKETDNPRPSVIFDAVDSVSGIDYYRIKIDERDFFTVSPNEFLGGAYTLPLQAPGKKVILAQAIDRAGNYMTASDEFVVQSISQPTIIDYPKELSGEEILVVRGETKYPDSEIFFWLQRKGDDFKSYTVKTDGAGKFTFIAEEKLRDGIYKLWAEAVDGRGARSIPTEKLTIAVQAPAFLRIGSLAVSVLSVTVPIVAILIVLLFFSLRAWYKLVSFRRKIKKEVREAESALHQAFSLLRDDIRKQINMLEKIRVKRPLTAEEKRIIKQLRSDLNTSEKFVGKEIEDIEEEVK